MIFVLNIVLMKELFDWSLMKRSYSSLQSRPQPGGEASGSNLVPTPFDVIWIIYFITFSIFLPPLKHFCPTIVYFLVVILTFNQPHSHLAMVGENLNLEYNLILVTFYTLKIAVVKQSFRKRRERHFDDCYSHAVIYSINLVCWL